MKGTTPTKSQRHYWSMMCEVVGCVACRKDGGFNSYCLPHHIDGRTKPDAHWLVLPLCGPHHQDMGISGVIPVHPYKTRFEAAYGKQTVLLKKAIQILLDGGFKVPEAALAAAGVQEKCPASVAADPGASHNALEV